MKIFQYSTHNDYHQLIGLRNGLCVKFTCSKKDGLYGAFFHVVDVTFERLLKSEPMLREKAS